MPKSTYEDLTPSPYECDPVDVDVDVAPDDIPSPTALEIKIGMKNTDAKEVRQLLSTTGGLLTRIEQLNRGLEALQDSPVYMTVGDGMEAPVVASVPFNKELAKAMLETQRDGYLEQYKKIEAIFAEMTELFNLDNIRSNLNTIRGGPK